MALTKIKVNEIDEKPAPVAGDYALASDSENDGKLILIPFSGIPLPTNAMTTDTNQVVTGAKTFLETNFYYGPAEAINHSPFVFGCGSTPFWRFRQNTNGDLVIQCNQTGSSVWNNALLFKFQSAGTIPYVQLYNAAVCVTQETSDNSTKIATTAFVHAATANAIYDLPVTRTGLVAPGTDVVIFETANALNPAWYDTTHVLNVSFFAQNDSGVSGNTTFKVQLYDSDTSTAHTIASITADTLYYNLLQAYIYRASSSSVNCNIRYGSVSSAGYASLAAGSYKLRVVCTSTHATIFAAAQVRFTK